MPEPTINVQVTCSGCNYSGPGNEINIKRNSGEEINVHCPACDEVFEVHLGDKVEPVYRVHY